MYNLYFRGNAKITDIDCIVHVCQLHAVLCRTLSKYLLYTLYYNNYC